MAYDFSTMTGGYQKATELITSIYDQVDAAFYDVLYPDILWKECIPAGSVKTDIAPGAMNHVYRSRDIKGMGQFIQGSSANIPRVGQVIGQTLVPIQSAAVGCTVMDDEAERYQFGMQSSLAQDLAEVMKRCAEKHVERTFFFGDDLVGFLPYMDYSTVTKVPADAWTGTDPTVWIDAINETMTSMWTDSKTEHMPNEIQMPPNLLSILLKAMVIGTGSVGVAMSALDYLKKNNICTLITGKELTIKPLRYLQGAGVDGADRIIIKEVNERNQVMPFPMAYQLAQPVPIALGVETFARYIFGSFNMRYPKSMVYMDVAQADSSL